MKFKKIGLVLGGGGGKGSYQVGVYKALKEFGLADKIACISGTSIGSLNLTLFANQDVEKAEKIWTNLKRTNVLTFNNVKEYLKLSNFSIFSRKGMLNIFKDNINLEEVSKSKLPLFVTAYNEEKDISTTFQINNMVPEKIIKCIMASSAIPKVFQSVNIDGENYSDGYVKDNVPVSILNKIGCDLIFVIPLSEYGAPYEGMYPDTYIIDFKDKIFDNVGTWEGTLGFDKEIAKRRIDLGYKNAIKIITYLNSIGFFETGIKKRFHYFMLRIFNKIPNYKKYYSLKDTKNKINSK
ncbi:MAG: patatin-like phospholipase family protein [Bacilli bacterium]|nr:patatin-like phospholipase family protein [Bacilli bacterium]